MKNYISYPISYGLNKIGLPLIVVDVGEDESLCFLLDTGSTQNMLEYKVIQYFARDITLLGETTIMGMEGIRKKVLTLMFSFKIQDKEYNTEFCMFEEKESFLSMQEDLGSPVHGILGSTFFIENKWIIDYDKMKVYYKE